MSNSIFLVLDKLKIIMCLFLLNIYNLILLIVQFVLNMHFILNSYLFLRFSIYIFINFILSFSILLLLSCKNLQIFIIKNNICFIHFVIRSFQAFYLVFISFICSFLNNLFPINNFLLIS